MDNAQQFAEFQAFQAFKAAQAGWAPPPVAPPAPAKRGRPKGSRNKAKAAKVRGNGQPFYVAKTGAVGIRLGDGTYAYMSLETVSSLVTQGILAPASVLIAYVKANGAEMQATAAAAAASKAA